MTARCGCYRRAVEVVLPHQSPFVVRGVWRASPTRPPSLRRRRRVADDELRRELDVERFEPLVVEHPLDEPLVASLMGGLRLAGRSAEAVAVYATTRQRIAGELGVEPDAKVHRRFQLSMQYAVDKAVRRGIKSLPEPLEQFLPQAA